jgi:hypothetical protein
MSSDKDMAGDFELDNWSDASSVFHAQAAIASTRFSDWVQSLASLAYDK